MLLAWMALLTYWSHQPSLPIDQPQVHVALFGFQHKLAHLFAFGLLALLARWTFDGLPRAAMLAIALTSAFGALDEYHQSFIPGRRSAIDDWLADTLFGALALYLHAVALRRGWGVLLRRVAPLVVACAFALAVGLAARVAA